MSDTIDTTEQIIEDDPIAVRRAKREALMAAGKDPYGHAFAYSHHLADLAEQYADLEDGASTEDEVKVAGRVMGEDGYATEELLLVGTSFEEGQALLAERGARPLQVQLVRGGVIDADAWGPEALSRAQERHLRARNELPYQAWRLSEGEVAIPTRYEQVD